MVKEGRDLEYGMMVTEVVKIASLQPLHRSTYSGSLSAADHEAALQLINHLMESLTQQVSWRERDREGEMREGLQCHARETCKKFAVYVVTQ